MTKILIKAFCDVMLMLKVSTECIQCSCAFSTQLSEFKVMLWLNLCRSMPSISVKDANVDQEEESWVYFLPERAHSLIILCTH